MIRIVKCELSSSEKNFFFDEISELVSMGERVYLIVPEQQTLLTESLMARLLPPSSVLTFEVTNFTRFANTTFRAVGGLSGEYCDRTKKALIMWRTLTELSPTLSIFSAGGEINSGLVDSYLSAVAEMQSKSISPDMLSLVSNNEVVAKDRRLHARVCDLAAIYSLYKNILGQRYADTGDDAEVMLKKLSENPDFLADSHIFIEGFTSFTEPQYKLIGLLCARCHVSVALTLPEGREGHFEFTELREAKDRLASVARAKTEDVKIIRDKNRNKNAENSLKKICQNLWLPFLPKEKISIEKEEDLRIFEADDPYRECSFVCEDIKRRVMEGAAYSDFAVIARNVEKYEGILDTALASAKIPAFTSYRKDIQAFEAIKLIYTAYAVCRGFRREDVLSYAKCSLSGITREECDEFEMYVSKWQISGKRFINEDSWTMNPDGYDSRSRDAERQLRIREKLLRIDEIRHKITDPLLELYRDVREAHTVKEQAECLLSFLLKIGMESALNKQACYLDSIGESSLASENRVLWQVICDALDTLVTVLGDSPSDFEIFLSQLKIVFSSTDIGKIPAFVDQVTVGSADMLRLYKKKHVYLIGVNAGIFPATVSESSYFSDKDKLTLKAADLKIASELEIKGARELYAFSRSFSYASDSVTISYSTSDTRFKAIEAAEVIERICLLTGGDVSPIKISSLACDKRLYSAETALESLGEMKDDYGAVKSALIRAGYADRVSVCEGDISNTSVNLGSEVVKRMSGGPLFLSQSKIDSYVKCPFGYFCRYVINLGAEELAEFDARSVGSFIHGILENFFRKLSKDGIRSGDLSPDERVRLTKEAAEKYLLAIGDEVGGSSMSTKVKIERLCRAAQPVVDGLCEEFKESLFEPKFFELSISDRDPDSPEALRINSEKGEIVISGTIDRVDSYKSGDDVYLRVIDYKTGKKKFTPEDMTEGSNLQMFLYLKALVESEKESFRKSLGVGDGGRVIPAGVIYVKTAVGDVRIDTPDDASAETAVKEAQAREGMILNSEEVISAMTLKYSPVYSSRYPDKVPQNKQNLLYTEDGWSNIMETVEGAVVRVGSNIRDGKMTASPKEDKEYSPCEYCEFKPICRKG